VPTFDGGSAPLLAGAALVAIAGICVFGVSIVRSVKRTLLSLGLLVNNYMWIIEAKN